MSKIATLSLATLATVFNQVSAKQVAKFADKAAAVRRVTAALAEKNLRLELLDGGGYELVSTAPTSAAAPAPAATAKGEAKKTTAKKTDGAKKASAEPKTFAAPKEKTARKARGFRFVFPKKDVIKPHRPGTKRAKAVELMSRPEGASFDELVKKCGWPTQKDTYEGVRLVHFYLGYGMRQDADGNIHLVGKPTKTK